MRRKLSRKVIGLLLAVGLLIVVHDSSAKELVQEWEIINPEGVVMIKPVEIAPRLRALEGKTVALRWNGKPNGDKFLMRVGELLAEKVKDVKIIKTWDLFPETAVISHAPEKAKEFGKKISGLKPDTVIASSAD